VPIATGAALSAQMKGEDRAIVVFVGDATTEEGVMSESLNFAALKRLPIVFFCENNFYSVQSPLSTRQPERSLSAWAAGHGVAAASVDGMNVLEVRDATRTAVARARAGDGPTFIEARLYRYRAHGGAGDDSRTGYRDEEERRAWESFCPVTMFGDFLSRSAHLTAAAGKEMEDALATEIAEAFEFALASPNPIESDLSRYVYAE
jgi:pyruvate dehydrogenase E1 component alpha subunit